MYYDTYHVMNICVKYFASIKDKMGTDMVNIQVDKSMSVDELIKDLVNGENITDNDLVAVNHEYVNRDFKLKDGDEVAFFPPVTGG